MASQEITQLMNNTKAPYNISTPTSLIAKSALSPASMAKLEVHLDEIKTMRDGLIKDLQCLTGIGRILGGNHGNFILAEILNQEGRPCNSTAYNVYKKLAEVGGIVVRYRGTELGCLGCLRITVGTEEENRVLIEKLHEFL
jgi:histidinol-phosphate aminotransferase